MALFGDGLEMLTDFGIGIPVLFSGECAVSTADQVEEVFSEFDVVGYVVDALGAIGFLHGGTSILKQT